MKLRTFLLAVNLAVLSSVSLNTLAITTVDSVPQGASVDAPRMGIVEEYTPGAFIKIDGTTYIFDRKLATVYDETGKVAIELKLSKGTPVRFLTKQDGSRQRVTALWILKK